LTENAVMLMHRFAMTHGKKANDKANPFTLIITVDRGGYTAAR